MAVVLPKMRIETGRDLIRGCDFGADSYSDTLTVITKM